MPNLMPKEHDQARAAGFSHEHCQKLSGLPSFVLGSINWAALWAMAQKYGPGVEQFIQDLIAAYGGSGTPPATGT